MQVANIQATVFAAACAILCGINMVGAVLYSLIEKSKYNSANAKGSTHQLYHDWETENESLYSKRVDQRTTTAPKPLHVWRCEKCGAMISQEPCPICSK